MTKFQIALQNFNDILTEKYSEKPLSEKDAVDWLTGDETEKEIMQFASDYANEMHTERCQLKAAREEVDYEIETFYRTAY